MTLVTHRDQALELLHNSRQLSEASRPDLILLDLNLPRKDGRAVLPAVNADPELNDLPVVIFTTSHAPRDIARCYELGANSYVSKPGNLGQFFSAVRSIDTFWFGFASLPD